MIYVLLITGMLVCAVMAVRATHLLTAALWLAGVSALTAVIFYLIGAYMMAVIELSLSVGLITILLVFAISMVGANSPDQPVSRSLNIPLVLAMLLLVIGLTLPMLPPQTNMPDAGFSAIFWTLRPADVFAQVALIFAGVLGVLGLLAEPRRQVKEAEPTAAQAMACTEEPVSPAVSPSDEPEPELEKL